MKRVCAIMAAGLLLALTTASAAFADLTGPGNPPPPPPHGLTIAR